jgi:CDP-diacylglycerol--glycerol-3-phosphate 3-phosphatidyltransferase
MANLITLSRLLLLVVVVAIAYQPPAPWQFVNVVLLILVFVTDGLDGYVARRRNEATLFGALFDIAGDRIVELTMWIVLADLDLVPIWVPIVFVIRGTIVDTIRASHSRRRGESPFAMMETPLGRFIVAGKFMRIFYAVLKATAFCWLLFLQTFAVVLPKAWSAWGGVMDGFGDVLVYLAVLVCVVRGLPVVIEFVYQERDAILGRAGPAGPVAR